LEDAAPNLDPMIQLRMVENRQDGTTGACLRVLGAEDDATKPRLHDSARAHGAGFDCSIQAATRQTVVPQFTRRSAQGEDLCVRRRVMQMKGAVVGAREDAALVHDDRADGDFLFFHGAGRFAERRAHEFHVFHWIHRLPFAVTHTVIVTRGLPWRLALVVRCNRLRRRQYVGVNPPLPPRGMV